jgi:hypothetical protein
VADLPVRFPESDEHMLDAVRYLALRAATSPATRPPGIGAGPARALAAVEAAATERAEVLEGDYDALLGEVGALAGSVSTLTADVSALGGRVTALEDADPPPGPTKGGRITGASGTIEATAGRKLVLIAGGAYGNNNAAQTVRLRYAGVDVAAHPVRQAATTDRIGISLVAYVTAVVSATAEITVTAGNLYDPAIAWIELE